MLSLETGEKKILIPQGTLLLYSHTGHLIYTLNGKLVVAPFDLETLKVTATSIPVLEGLWTPANTPHPFITNRGWFTSAKIGDGRCRCRPGISSLRTGVATATRKQGLLCGKPASPLGLV